MSSWGTQRRNTILIIIFLLLFIPIATLLFLFYYEKPTCFDGEQNGSETGVDCGGNCKLICADEVFDPFVKWQRFFEVAPGVYNVIAYLENQNPNAGTDILRYQFTLFDSENAILTERTGQTVMRPREVLPIVENTLNTGTVLPRRVEFQILNDINWEQETVRDNVILVSDEKIQYTNESTRVNAVLNNISLGTVYDIEAVIILYNKEDNAIGVSSTIVDQIPANGEKNILFTWPKLFSEEIIRFEIIPLYELN